MKRERRHRPENVANDPRKEGESSMQGEAKRKAEHELQEEREEASRTRSTEGNEPPLLEASSSVSPNVDGEVGMGGPRKSTQLNVHKMTSPLKKINHQLIGTW